MAFAYRNGDLCAEQVSCEDIARRFGTPCFVYSRAAIENAYGEFAKALAARDSLVCYSVKANSNLALLAILARPGARRSRARGAARRGLRHRLGRRTRPGATRRGTTRQDFFLRRGQNRGRN